MKQRLVTFTIWIVLAAAFMAGVLYLLPPANGAERSSKWHTVRDQYIEIHPTCEACGQKATQVHHVTPYHIDPMLELDPANLIALCDTCHLRLAHLGDFKAWNPLVREDAARQLERVKARPYTREAADAFVKRFNQYQNAP